MWTYLDWKWKQQMMVVELCSTGEINRLFKQFKSSYDYVLIDCPPSLSLLTVMALASFSFTSTSSTEFFALEGITQLIKTIDRIKVD